MDGIKRHESKPPDSLDASRPFDVANPREISPTRRHTWPVRASVNGVDCGGMGSPSLPAYLAASGFFCCRMMLAKARSERLTASALGNTLATSGSSTTTFVPRA